MRAVVLALALGTLAVGGATHAQSMVDAWLVTGEPDRFGDGGTYVAATAARDGAPYIFGVRCIHKEWSLALVDSSLDPKPLTEGDIFQFKLRVDREPIIETPGIAINDRVIQFVAADDVLKEILDGRELAIRVQTKAGTSLDMVFKVGKARKALAQHLKECPAP